MGTIQLPTDLTRSDLRASMPRKRHPRPGWFPRLRSLAGKALLLVLTSGLVAYAGNRWYRTARQQPTEITATVVRGTLPIVVTERGELQSAKTVDARCEVEGLQTKIVTILTEGTPVKKGQVCVTFDADQLLRNFAEQEVKVEQAVGKAKAAKGDLEVAKNKADSEINKAVLALKLANLDRDKYVQGEYKALEEEANGDLELARRDLLEAEDRLFKTRLMIRRGFAAPAQLTAQETEISRQKYLINCKQAKLDVLVKFTKQRQETELKAKAEDALLDVERAKRSGEASVDKAQSDLRAAEVTAKLEKNTLDRIQKLLDRCVVTAPQDGIIIYSHDRDWDPNSRVQPGATVHYQQMLFSLPDLSQMQVSVKVHESMVKKIKSGMKADIQVDAYPNRILHGEVKSVATIASSEWGWMRGSVKEYITIVKIEDLPGDAGLKPGFTAEVKIHAKELPDVLLVPVQAVTEIERKHYAYVANGDGIERREVDIGENNEKLVEVKGGLDEGWDPLESTCRHASLSIL